LLPAAWRERWAVEAARYGDRSLPGSFDDLPNAGLAMTRSQADAEARSLTVARGVREAVVPMLVSEARDRG
jgi:hypothetical protein